MFRVFFYRLENLFVRSLCCSDLLPAQRLPLQWEITPVSWAQHNRWTMRLFFCRSCRKEAGSRCFVHGQYGKCVLMHLVQFRFTPGPRTNEALCMVLAFVICGFSQCSNSQQSKFQQDSSWQGNSLLLRQVLPLHIWQLPETNPGWDPGGGWGLMAPRSVTLLRTFSK